MSRPLGLRRGRGGEKWREKMGGRNRAFERAVIKGESGITYVQCLSDKYTSSGFSSASLCLCRPQLKWEESSFWLTDASSVEISERHFNLGAEQGKEGGHRGKGPITVHHQKSLPIPAHELHVPRLPNKTTMDCVRFDAPPEENRDTWRFLSYGRKEGGREGQRRTD